MLGTFENVSKGDFKAFWTKYDTFLSIYEGTNNELPLPCMINPKCMNDDAGTPGVKKIMSNLLTIKRLFPR